MGVERLRLGNQFAGRGREGKPRLRRRAKDDGAAPVSGKKLDRALKEHFAVLWKRLDFVKNKHGVCQPVKTAGGRIGRGVARVQKLNKAGQNDITVPALGQAFIGGLFILRFQDTLE